VVWVSPGTLSSTILWDTQSSKSFIVGWWIFLDGFADELMPQITISDLISSSWPFPAKEHGNRRTTSQYNLVQIIKRLAKC
jgi:hypothetical protein